MADRPDLAAIAEACGCARETVRGSFVCLCPAHGDSKPSLQLVIRDGRVRVRCYAGCKDWRVRQALRRRGFNIPKKRKRQCG